MRKLVKLVIIDSVIEHPNADALELAIVGGWQCCVKKGEFSSGDVALYFEIDSMLPIENEHFSFLTGRNQRNVAGVEYARIRTMKLRGEISQGILFPISILSNEAQDVIGAVGYRYSNWRSEGYSQDVTVELLNATIDFTSMLGIIKYEPKQSGAALTGKAKGNFPSFIPKTDQERYQNMRRKYEDLKAKHEEFEVSVKLDGSSFTAYVNFDQESSQLYTGVCSRNLELKVEDKGNAFVALFDRLNLNDKLMEYAERKQELIAIQGEMVGPGIQGNFEGLEEHELYVYNVYDIVNGRYLTPSVAVEVVKELGLNYVPVLGTYQTLPDYDKVQDIATGPSGLNGKYREGVVFKSEHDGSLSFKAVSNQYLLKEA